MSAEMPTAAPRVNLGDLPTELKTKVAQYCDEQDERYRHWTELASRQYSECQDTLASIRQLSTFHGSSVGALFCASKEWSEIMAPLRFKVLKASRTNSVAFRFHVGFRRSAHFTTLVLDKAPRPTHEALFPYLNQLSNVTDLSIHQSFLDAVQAGDPGIRPHHFWWHDTMTPSGATVAALNTIVSQVDRLALELHDPAMVTAFLERARRLESLRLDLGRLQATPDEVVALLSQKSGTLEELELRAHKLPELDYAALSNAKLPRLRSLALKVYELHPNILLFARLFSATLVRLSAEIETTPEDLRLWRSVVDEEAVFKSVEELELEAPDFAATDLVEPFTPDTLPSLRRFTARWSDGLVFELGEIDLTQGQISHALSFVHAPEHPFEEARVFDPIIPTWAIDARTLAAQSRIGGPRISLEPADMDVDDWAAAAREGDCKRAVDRAVDFLVELRRRTQAAGPGGDVEYRRMAAALRAVELERVAMQA
ncbi:hypothetical protein JCM10450v2_008254 [Rhodotorula kratochvilovae]